MYLKMVKTLSANHTSHTYKKSLTACAQFGQGARTGAVGLGWSQRQHGRLRGTEGLSREGELQAPAQGKGGLAWPAVHWRLLFRPGDSVRSPLCAQTPIQARAVGVAKKQCAKEPRILPPSCRVRYCLSPWQWWHRAAATCIRLSSPSKPSPGAGTSKQCTDTSRSHPTPGHQIPDQREQKRAPPTWIRKGHIKLS